MNVRLRYVFIIGILARLLLLTIMHYQNSDGFLLFDSYRYLTLSNNISAGHGFSLSLVEPYMPDHTRVPLYPLLISGALRNEFVVIFFQAILSLLTALIVYNLILKMSSNDYRFAKIGASIYLIDIPSILIGNTIMTEALFTFLLLVNVYVFWLVIKNSCTQNFMMLGILSSLCILCKPIAMFLPIIMLLCLLYLKKNAIKSVLMVLMSILTLMPWLIRNYNAFGSVFISTIGSTNLLYYRAAEIASDVTEKPIETIQAEYWDELVKKFRVEYYYKPDKISQYQIEKAFNIFVSHPYLLAKNTVYYFLKFFFVPDRGLSSKIMAIDRNHWILKLSMGYQLFIQLLLILGCFLLAIKCFSNNNLQERLFISFVITVIIYFALLSSGAEVSSRFRVPVQPLIIILFVISAKQMSSKDSNILFI